MNNAILIGPCKTRIPIDGSLSNAFEYFYYVWEKNKSIFLIIDTSRDSLNVIFKYLKIKYNINEKCFKNIIIFEKKIQKYNNLILFEMIAIDNFNYYKNFIFYNKLFALSGSKNHKLKCYYFVEYEHLKPLNYDINYKSKIYFEILKKPLKSKNLTFINTRNPNYIKKENEIMRSDLNLVSNIFENFNKMIYIQHPNFFDVKPRLFQECSYFNIPYEFIPHSNCFDGANYRAYEKDLNLFKMNSNDEIIKVLNEI